MEPLRPRRTRDHRLCLSSGCLLKRATKGNYGKSHEMCHVIIARKAAPRKALKVPRAGRGERLAAEGRRPGKGRAGRRAKGTLPGLQGRSAGRPGVTGRPGQHAGIDAAHPPGVPGGARQQTMKKGPPDGSPLNRS